MENRNIEQAFIPNSTMKLLNLFQIAYLQILHEVSVLTNMILTGTYASLPTIHSVHSYNCPFYFKAHLFIVCKMDHEL